MSLQRIPEPEPEDARFDATAYHEMDHADVNEQFVADLFCGMGDDDLSGEHDDLSGEHDEHAGRGQVGPRIIDLGCGPADIPIRIGRRLAESEFGYAPEPWQIMAIDSEVEMLEIAKMEIQIAGLNERITLQQADIADLEAFEDGFADTVISNSVIHHCDDPERAFAQHVRLTSPGGRLFVRDLARPETDADVESLVGIHAADENAYAQQLLRQSLHAALSMDEVQRISRGLGVPVGCVQMTSDRHWTIDWKRTE